MIKINGLKQEWWRNIELLDRNTNKFVKAALTCLIVWIKKLIILIFIVSDILVTYRNLIALNCFHTCIYFKLKWNFTFFEFILDIFIFHEMILLKCLRWIRAKESRCKISWNHWYKNILSKCPIICRQRWKAYLYEGIRLQ